MTKPNSQNSSNSKIGKGITMQMPAAIWALLSVRDAGLF